MFTVRKIEKRERIAQILTDRLYLALAETERVLIRKSRSGVIPVKINLAGNQGRPNEKREESYKAFQSSSISAASYLTNPSTTTFHNITTKSDEGRAETGQTDLQMSSPKKFLTPKLFSCTKYKFKVV